MCVVRQRAEWLDCCYELNRLALALNASLVAHRPSIPLITSLAPLVCCLRTAEKVYFYLSSFEKLFDAKSKWQLVVSIADTLWNAHKLCSQMYGYILREGLLNLLLSGERGCFLLLNLMLDVSALWVLLLLAQANVAGSLHRRAAFTNGSGACTKRLASLFLHSLMMHLVQLTHRDGYGDGGDDDKRG